MTDTTDTALRHATAAYTLNYRHGQELALRAALAAALHIYADTLRHTDIAAATWLQQQADQLDHHTNGDHG